MKQIKLDEQAIIKRLSNGEKSVITGGLDNLQNLYGTQQTATAKSCGSLQRVSVCKCVAGCGCNPYSACVTCHA